MNLTKIRYFVEVARCGNFSEAARRLYTAQPNVSKQIAQMEQELDFSLFVRSKRAVKLTPAGQLLYDRLKDLPDELEQLFDQARQLSRREEARLNIGILEGQEVSAILLTRLNLAQALYPNLELELERNSFSNLRNGLKNGHYDLIVTLDFDVEEEKEFYSVPVCPQPPAIAIHRNHPLAQEPELEMTQLKKAVLDLKNEIRSLGSVNVNAIEEFKEISERHSFLKGQHDDLVESEKALLGVIDDLDAGMRRQFEENFVKIQTEFDKAFRQLFGGGHGKLELVEGEDILEAGVRIIAQPPGKKLQNMILLSGGEKALTAIALLFAIQNLKPSPFCLLDEIEAALDESNVARYANYLHKLTKNTQFIIITHRRGTMAAADRLYGITMQEKGVSALVSVNLIEDDLDE